MSGSRARPRYTDAQRRAIRTTGHTLLEAGAGSGKTTTLVGKMLHALGADVVDARVAHACELSELAAITFTTAAAADLRRSLRDRLRAYADAHPGEPRWRQLVYEVDRARIGTIHSFCGQILREFALRDGRDPGFAILDAGEADALRDACARDALYSAVGDGDAAATDLAVALGTPGAVRAIRQAVERGATAATPATPVLRLAVDARAAFDAALDAQGALDYDALIHRTRDLLGRSPETVASLRRRLAWLFIDEFQDTDPAQRDIAYLLCGVSEALAGHAPAARCPALCIVGDPKQSIYGFRRADVTVWNAVARDFASLGADVIPLADNFRSRAPLLGFVDATLGAVMPGPDDAAAEYEVRFQSLTPARDYAGDDALVELLVLPAGENASERRKEEARRIARRVHAMVHDAEPIVLDESGAKQPVGWRDVALLFRSASDVRLYEAELRRLNVPCWVAAGDGFFATREVRDVRLLLTALVDAHDDVAWAGVLRSP